MGRPNRSSHKSLADVSGSTPPPPPDPRSEWDTFSPIKTGILATKVRKKIKKGEKKATPLIFWFNRGVRQIILAGISEIAVVRHVGLCCCWCSPLPQHEYFNSLHLYVWKTFQVSINTAWSTAQVRNLSQKFISIISQNHLKYYDISSIDGT